MWAGLQPLSYFAEVLTQEGCSEPAVFQDDSKKSMVRYASSLHRTHLEAKDGVEPEREV
jgi:hypothetical protein